MNLALMSLTATATARQVVLWIFFLAATRQRDRQRARRGGPELQEAPRRRVNAGHRPPSDNPARLPALARRRLSGISRAGPGPAALARPLSLHVPRRRSAADAAPRGGGPQLRTRLRGSCAATRLGRRRVPAPHRTVLRPGVNGSSARSPHSRPGPRRGDSLGSPLSARGGRYGPTRARSARVSAGRSARPGAASSTDSTGTVSGTVLEPLPALGGTTENGHLTGGLQRDVPWRDRGPTRRQETPRCDETVAQQAAASSLLLVRPFLFVCVCCQSIILGCSCGLHGGLRIRFR